MPEIAIGGTVVVGGRPCIVHDTDPARYRVRVSVARPQRQGRNGEDCRLRWVDIAQIQAVKGPKK